MSRRLKIDKSKKRLRTQLRAGADELLQAGMLKGAHIEMFSNKELTVEGCCGVYEYTDCYIRLNLGHGALIISGEKLDISSFEERSIVIRGSISSLEFCV